MPLPLLPGERRHAIVYGIDADAKGARAEQALFSPPDRDALADFLEHAVESAPPGGSAPGCPLLCVAPLVNDAEVRQFLQDAAAAGVA